jgi:2-oxoglutarate dehydrogenase E2 component (dihydrolipoamide succinyltransferase)
MLEIKIPSPGESITEALLAKWLVNDGDFVEKDQEVAEIESDKATLPLIASESGQIKFMVQAGETVNISD